MVIEKSFRFDVNHSPIALRDLRSFGLIAFDSHRRRFLSASLLIIPSSLRRKINKGRKLRKMPKSSEVLNSPLHPHCAPLFPSPLCKFWLSSGRAKSRVAMTTRRSRDLKIPCKEFPPSRRESVFRCAGVKSLPPRPSPTSRFYSKCSRP